MKIVHIDAQNIYQGLRELGVIIDRSKFWVYLQDRFHPDCMIVYGLFGYWGWGLQFISVSNEKEMNILKNPCAKYPKSIHIFKESFWK